MTVGLSALEGESKMARMRHGQQPLLKNLELAVDGVRSINSNLRLASAPSKVYEMTPYDYMFTKLLGDPDAFLAADKPEEMVARLIALGETMNEPGTDPELDSAVPSAYTYFGQFVNHDITLELQ